MRTLLRVKIISIRNTPGRYMMYEKLNSEAKLTKSPRVKIVSSRCNLNSISVNNALSASKRKPKAARSAVKDKTSKDRSVSNENIKVGM